MECVLIMNVKYRNIYILCRAKSGNWKKSNFLVSAFGKNGFCLVQTLEIGKHQNFYKVHAVKYGFCLNYKSEMSIFCVV